MVVKCPVCKAPVHCCILLCLFVIVVLISHFPIFMMLSSSFQTFVLGVLLYNSTASFKHEKTFRKGSTPQRSFPKVFFKKQPCHAWLIYDVHSVLVDREFCALCIRGIKPSTLTVLC